MAAAYTDLVLRDDTRSIAERNEDFNRRRREEQQRQACAGGKLTIRDPAAFARFVAEAERYSAEAAALEEREEAERARREGGAYKPRAAREAEARARRQRASAGRPDEDEARGVRDWADVTKDYYRALGVDRLAATHEIKKAYKRLAMQLHPDKHRGASAEALESVASQFKAVSEAYDVLSDEERRASYDRMRAHAAGGARGAGLGPRTAEEAAAMMRGMREMARLRREGMRRSVKAPPLAAAVRVSLEKLYRGCTKGVRVVRRCVDPSGALYDETKTFHAVIRKGAAPGSTVVFPEQGSETAELLPGDVVITVRDKPHPQFKREGPKDLVYAAPPLRRGDALYALRLRTLGGREALLFGSPLAASLAAGGAGGVVATVLPGEGMPDPDDPWEHPPGDLTVRMLNPPVPPERRAVRCALRQRAVVLLPDPRAALAAAAAGSVAGAAMRRELEADEMETEELLQGGDSTGKRSAPVTGLIVVLTDGADGAGAASAAADAFATAATAALRMLRWRRVRVVIPEHPADAPAEMLLDDEWAALASSRALVVDYDAGCCGGDAAADPAAAIELAERRIRRAHAALASSGVLDALWLRHWRGAQVAGVGAGGVALLGAAPPEALGPAQALPRALLPLPLRAGGGSAGWSALHAALSSWGGRDTADGDACCDAANALVGAGVLVGSALSVGPAIWWQPEGAVELLVAPPREVLVATAAAVAAAARRSAGADEDDAGAYAEAGFAACATRAAAGRAARDARDVIAR